MRFTTGDVWWDFGFYGTVVVLLALFLTSLQAGNLYFSVLVFLALVAELWVIWKTFVPFLKDQQIVDGKTGELKFETAPSENEYRTASQALQQRNREFMHDKIGEQD